MTDKIVCLGCGMIVDGPGEWGCKCPPPSVVPAHKRIAPLIGDVDLPASAPCPRCAATLAKAQFRDVPGLDCGGCGGLFLPSAAIEAITHPDGHKHRLAFPQRARSPEADAVRYLKCPTCAGIMNRQNFGTKSGVVVDVCKDHGIWFDAGEVNAVIVFVDRGGLAEAERELAERRAVEKARIKDRFVRESREAAAQPVWTRNRSGILGSRDDALVDALVDFLTF